VAPVRGPQESTLSPIALKFLSLHRRQHLWISHPGKHAWKGLEEMEFSAVRVEPGICAPPGRELVDEKEEFVDVMERAEWLAGDQVCLPPSLCVVCK